MKSLQDPRHLRRKHIVEELFSRDFHTQRVSKKVEEIFAHKSTIDMYIAKAAPEFPVEKINKIDLAILRLAVYELYITKETPPKVVVDEAVELAKEYGGTTSPAFINGALGKLVKV